MAYVTNFERLARLREACESVVEVLEVKFGSVEKDLQTKLEQIQKKELLRQLLREGTLASSLDDFKKNLS